MKKAKVLTAFILFFVYGSANGVAPYPPSVAIKNLTWAPSSTIVRMGTDSDNWPCTWADDDNLYTAGGDGRAFGSTRKSSWVCSIAGSPPDLKGANVSDLGTGDGKAGSKGCGMLMVDGILYMWVRNADGNGKTCQLYYSSNRGSSWSSGFTRTEFGYCTFVNFGQNYAGARDNYVYTVSHDNSNAYSAANQFVLMRVAKDKIKNQSDYEFFKSRNADGSAVWTSNKTQRGAVFEHTGNCLRSGMSYNAALGRYLWWQQNGKNGPDTRRSGGFGVYDAPEPWGPWTTVYFTDSWDVGPGDTGNFPTKWMSENGKTLYLVFSGNDDFSVRKATLSLDETKPYFTSLIQAQAIAGSPFGYKVTYSAPDGIKPSIGYLQKPIWLNALGDSLYGTPSLDRAGKTDTVRVELTANGYGDTLTVSIEITTPPAVLSAAASGYVLTNQALRYTGYVLWYDITGRTQKFDRSRSGISFRVVVNSEHKPYFAQRILKIH